MDTLITIDVAQIAKVCHEANRAYAQTLGDKTLKSWEECEQAQRDSILQGVLFRINNPDAGPSASHDSWMAAKVKDGWKYGPSLDREAKIHPAMVPFEKLPVAVQIKDNLFTGIVNSITAALEMRAQAMTPPPMMQILAGEKNDPSVEIGAGAARHVTPEYLKVMATLGFREAEGSFIFNAKGRAIWVNPKSPSPTQDITEQIVEAAEAIGARTKINQIREALDIPFEVVATASNAPSFPMDDKNWADDAK
jgi:hypothetical protein